MLASWRIWLCATPACRFRTHISYKVILCYGNRKPGVETAMTSSTADWPDPVPYPELSERQQQILQFLWTYPRRYGPSMREIGKAVGLKGPSPEIGRAHV